MHSCSVFFFIITLFFNFRRVEGSSVYFDVCYEAFEGGKSHYTDLEIICDKHGEIQGER